MSEVKTKTRMKIKASVGEQIFNWVNVLILSLAIVIVLIPIIHVVAASFSDPMEYAKHEGLLLFPLGFSIESYKAVFKNVNILYGYRNTLFIVLSATFLNIIMTWIAAYVLSRKDLMWKQAMTLFVIFTMYFNGGMIPTYIVIKNLGLYNSLLSLIIPGAINVFNLVVMRTAMEAIPEDLIEVAELDGANHIYILIRIVIPLVKATTAVICLYYAVAHWNEWFNAMLYLRERSKYPLQLVLREILIVNDLTDMTAGSGADEFMLSETIQFATIVVATVPILLVYPFLQKYFVKGVMVGAVKG